MIKSKILTFIVFLFISINVLYTSAQLQDYPWDQVDLDLFVADVGYTRNLTLIESNTTDIYPANSQSFNTETSQIYNKQFVLRSKSPTVTTIKMKIGENFQYTIQNINRDTWFKGKFDSSNTPLIYMKYQINDSGGYLFPYTSPTTLMNDLQSPIIVPDWTLIIDYLTNNSFKEQNSNNFGTELIEQFTYNYSQGPASFSMWYDYTSTETGVYNGRDYTSTKTALYNVSYDIITGSLVRYSYSSFLDNGKVGEGLPNAKTYVTTVFEDKSFDWINPVKLEDQINQPKVDTTESTDATESENSLSFPISGLIFATFIFGILSKKKNQK